MLNEITKNLQIICDYKINKTAAMNILLAKLTYIFGFKNCKFQSIQNVGRFTPLAHYAFNFVPSGGTKNRLLTEIDTHLLSFFDSYLNKFNDERYDTLENEWELELQAIKDKIELRRKKMECENELKNFKRLKKEITNATQAKIYNSLEIIDKNKEGSVIIVNSEFANYYEDAILNKDKMKKEFLDMMYNLYDGEFQSTDTISTSRDNIKNISASCIFLSDYKLLLENEKLCQSFKSYLARGMARRSFIYFRKNENYYTQNLKYATFEEKEEAINNLKSYANKLKNIFDSLEKNKEFYFNQEANEAINQYKIALNKKIASFYKYTNVLDSNTEILKLNLEHSTWKIIKLAVLYHILDNPTKKFIKIDSFNQAVDFFNETHKCLEDMLQDKVISDYDKLYNYLVKNINKILTKTDLRNEKFVPNKDFKTWFTDALISVKDKCVEKGFGFYAGASGKRNESFIIVVYDDRYTFTNEGKLIATDLSDREVKLI